MLRRFIYIIGVMILTVMSSCSSNQEDGLEVPVSGGTLQVMPLSSSFVDVRPMTRADNLPDGYIWYQNLSSATNPAYANIGMFMTPERKSPSADYIYQLSDKTWKSTIRVDQGTDYYMYGFMPRQGAESSSITALNNDNDYSKGAKIHLSNFKTFTPADVCVVVGVRKATAAEKTEGTAQSVVNLGAFNYEGGAENENAAFILLKHIYSGLQFRAVIDKDYHKLREIKFTKVELIAKNMESTVDIDVTITANDTGADPLTELAFSNYASAVESNTIELFPWTGSVAEYQLKESEDNMFLGCFTPGKCSEFVVRTTYNVYDKAGNRIRQGCVAENQINESIVPGLKDIEAGEVYTVTCTVKPTYLYVLSEPDLDNPTIELTN